MENILVITVQLKYEFCKMSILFIPILVHFSIFKFFAFIFPFVLFFLSIIFIKYNSIFSFGLTVVNKGSIYLLKETFSLLHLFCVCVWAIIQICLLADKLKNCIINKATKEILFSIIPEEISYLILGKLSQLMHYSSLPAA